jgi:hypothetical protein
MTSDSPLDDWLFLIGKWKGSSKDQFGGKGIIETTSTFSLELGGFILGKHEARRDGKIENQEISVLFYDRRNKKFRRKTFFSYGFVNNEIEYSRSDEEIRFDVVSEPSPQAFDGIRWRSYIKKISDVEVLDGLESAKPDEDYKSYGEDSMKKIN